MISHEINGTGDIQMSRPTLYAGLFATVLIVAVLITLGGGETRALVQSSSSSGASASSAVPFKIQVPDAVLSDLKDRLARTRYPDQVEGAGWDYGTNLGYLKELIAYWRDTFNWREQERRLN